jgi:murein hydrolase activator
VSEPARCECDFEVPSHIPAVAPEPQPAPDRSLAPAYERANRWRWHGKIHALRAWLIGAVLLSGLAALPRPLPAHVVPTGPAPSGRLEMDPLGEVRDQLERQRALERNLRARMGVLAREIEALGAQGERTAAVLESEREQARALEHRLDRLLPRLLARVAEADERRAQAARALAELAGRSRSPSLAPAIRARMSALGPVMLERLRGIEDRVVSLRGDRDRMIERHEKIEQRLADLTATQQRVQHERAQRRSVRQAAANRLRSVEAEVRLLNEKQARLAHDFPHDDEQMMARAESPAERRALTDRGGVGGTSGRGAAVDSRSVARTTPAGGSWHRKDARVVAATPAADSAFSAAEPAAGGRAPGALPAKPSTTALRGELAASWPGVSRKAVSQPAAVDVAYLPDGGSLPTDAARLHGASPEPPILTVPAHSYDQRLIAHGGPEVAIRAAPGQAVAAPVEGRVAFAGSFKSYGLLLILEHEGEYHTLLWGFARLEVRQGDQVQVGRIVGFMDARGDDPPVLHVERRRRGRPIDIAASSNGIQG